MELRGLAVSWNEDQQWEKSWWNGCTNTLSEELKQLSYFKRLGLVETPPGSVKTRFVFDMHGKSVLDIGGGPCSFLLKCVNVKGIIVDPCDYPRWICERYRESGIDYWWCCKGEAITGLRCDEVWIYNVLQHVEDPQKIIQNALKAGKTLRLFDWINAGVHPGHPHNLTAEQLDSWIGGKGTVEQINENDAVGECYYIIKET